MLTSQYFPRPLQSANNLSPNGNEIFCSKHVNGIIKIQERKGIAFGVMVVRSVVNINVTYYSSFSAK